MGYDLSAAIKTLNEALAVLHDNRLHELGAEHEELLHCDLSKKTREVAFAAWNKKVSEALASIAEADRLLKSLCI